MTPVAHLFGLPNVTQPGLELAVVVIVAVGEPSCFLSVTWHGEAFYRLGVQGVEV
jgi:hypothetical protein